MRGLIRLAALSATLASPAFAEDALVAQRPIFHEGDRFTYAGRFETLDCREWVVRQVDAAGNLAATSCGDYTAFYAPDGAMTRIAGKDGRSVVKFSPKSAGIPFPLQVGQHWKARFEVSTASQMVTPTIDESCEVAGIEPVPVGNASLQSFRIVCSDRWSVAFLSGSNASTLWYAPEARSVVKADNPASTEWNLQMTGYSFN